MNCGGLDEPAGKATFEFHENPSEQTISGTGHRHHDFAPGFGNFNMDLDIDLNIDIAIDLAWLPPPRPN
jgi:hypothetical protein